jgi:hypothetical protein
MRNLRCVAGLAVVCAFVVSSGANVGTPAFGQTTSEPLSKTYRVTRAADVEFQKIQEASGARVMAAEEDWKMIEQVGSRPGRGGAAAPRVPKKDMVVKEGDILSLGGQKLTFHLTPGHTPGVVTTEGITAYDAGRLYRAIVWGGAGYRGGLSDAEESVRSADKVAQIQGVQVNLQIHSWAEPNGYPGGGVLERGLRLKSRKAGDAHPFIDPATFTQWVKRAQENAALPFVFCKRTITSGARCQWTRV